MFSPPQRYFTVQPEEKPAIDSDEAKKRLFGIELSKGLKPFDAALAICGEDTADAVYISVNWLNDPIVIASRDIYSKTIAQSEGLLDKDQFAARLLSLSEDWALEGKDRLKALELYAKVQGFIDKPGDNSTKIFNNNGITIKVVKPNIEEKTIDISEKEIASQASPVVQNDDKALPIKLKLVS